MTIQTLRLAIAPARTGRLLAAAAAALGAACFAVGLGVGRARLAFAALDASWLFFAGLTAGCLALCAVVRISGAAWARPVLPIAEATASFLAPALALLLLLLLGARVLLPGAAGAALSLRQLVPSIVLGSLGWRLVARGAGLAGRRSLAPAVAYLLAYAVALSLWAFDWVMLPARAPTAAVVPAYYFTGAFLSGLAWVALVAALRGAAGPDLRHDLGKLLFALAVVWFYLLWALFLATWYGNVPAESEPLLRRWEGAWRPATAVVLVAVFLWPFLLLFSERLKRHRISLALGAGAILLGLWVERFLLVLPSLEGRSDALSLLVGGGVAVGVGGLFLLRVGPGLASAPR
jgi:hypothetical protein